MDINEIRKLIELVKETEIAELEIERGDEKIRIVRREQSSMTQPTVILSPAVGEISSSIASSSELKSGVIKEQKVEEEVKEKNLTSITSPMVGTFYRAPAPDADPFVEEGSIFEKNDVLCIIEAMKLMNEIKADFKGKVVKILVENGHPVEYGQPLFLVEKLE